MATGIRGAVEAQLEKMSPRDKKLLTGLILFVSFVVLALMTYTLVSVRQGLESNVRSAKTTLIEVQRLQREYDVAAATLKAQESRLEQYAGQQLSAYVEQLADEQGIKEGLRDAQRVEQIEENGVTMTKWKVVLKGRSYDEAIRFLLALENNGYPLKVETARMKRVTVKREAAVDLTIELYTFKVAES
ncbi:MAG: type II secretion system protein M [Alphaproteobacteria bacterium]|nr:type II secretion system protein M [Alphaproteobacteria bacterium]